jgi:Domain of unknown function (DUF4440)
MPLLMNAGILLQKTIDMKKLFIALFVLLKLNGTAQTGYSPEQMQVMIKMRDLKNSLIAKDSVTLSGLMADDVTYGHTNGIIQTKAQLIRSVMSGEQDYKTIEPSNINVRIYENTGVVTMNSKVIMNYQDKPLELNMFVTLVWIKNNNDWKLVARQSVKL